MEWQDISISLYLTNKVAPFLKVLILANWGGPYLTMLNLLLYPTNGVAPCLFLLTSFRYI